MMGSSMPRGSYVPEYENSNYKMPPPPQNYSQYQPPPPPQQMYQNNSSVALFHIPSDSTNSLYVDGVPNDTSEREVSRTCLLSQISSVPSRASSASASSRRPLQRAESFSFALSISRTLCSPPSPWTPCRTTASIRATSEGWRFPTRSSPRKSRRSPTKSISEWSPSIAFYWNRNLFIKASSCSIQFPLSTHGYFGLRYSCECPWLSIVYKPF